MSLSFENYCTMDDSQRIFCLDNQKLAIYTHYIFHPEKEKGDYLAIIKPRSKSLEESVLKEFVQNSIEGKDLIACSHYTLYKSLDEMITAYTNKNKIGKFKQDTKKNIRNAHKNTKSLSGRILKHIDKEELKKAIKKGKKKIYVDDIEVLLYGF